MRNKILGITFAAATALVLSGTCALGSWDASIAGGVTDVSSKQPVAGVKVLALTTGSLREQGSAVTDARGNFLITGLEGGQYVLEFDKTGYQRTALGGVEVRTHERHIEAGRIAVYPNGVPMPKTAVILHPCVSLVQPNQTADVYVRCSDTR